MTEKKSKLQEFYDNRILRSKVDTMLDEGKTLQFITDFCKAQKFDISLGTVNNYKAKLEESRRTNTPIEELIDRRKKVGNIIELKAKEDDALGEIVTTPGSKAVQYETANDKMISLLEPLELLMQKGLETAKMTAVVDQPTLLKTIDLYSKITGAAAGGLTIQGLQEIRLKQKAMESAYTEIILEYIPEEKRDEVLKEFAVKEQAFFDNLDLTAEGQRIQSALKKAGLNS